MKEETTTEERFEKFDEYGKIDMAIGNSRKKKLLAFIKQEKDLTREQVKSEIIKFVQENHKGTFTDNAGNDCWYIDELVKGLNNLSLNSIK